MTDERDPRDPWDPPAQGQPPAAPEAAAPGGSSSDRQSGQPGYGQQTPAPQWNQPQYGAQPPYPTQQPQPTSGPPQYGQPQQPPYGQQYGQPQYGQPQYGQPQSSQASTVQTLGIVSLVLLFVCGFFAFIPALIALVKANAARREIAESGGRLGGAEKVRAGVIMSWITIGISALFVVAAVIIIVVAVSVSDGDSAGNSGVVVGSLPGLQLAAG